MYKTTNKRFALISSEELYNSLTLIIKNDSLSQLKEFINSYNLPFKTMKFNCCQAFPLYRINTIFETQISDVNIVDYCSFWGSVNCFKFLIINGYSYGRYIKQMSICGCNWEIIHEVENIGISFDYCFEYSVKYHQKQISEWFLSNYKCEILPLAKCFNYFDHETFLFLLFNGVDINSWDLTPLGYLCIQKVINYEAIRYLIENGADINKEFTHAGLTFTPFSYALIRNRAHIEMVHFLLEYGADVNKEFPLYGSYIYTPFCFLIQEKTVDYELINTFIECGADVNKEFKIGNNIFNPLGYLMDQPHSNRNHQLINILFSHKAYPLYNIHSNKKKKNHP